jgi:hypothetical protein
LTVFTLGRQFQVGLAAVGQMQLIPCVFRFTYPASRPWYCHTAQDDALCTCQAFPPPQGVVPLSPEGFQASPAFRAIPAV